MIKYDSVVVGSGISGLTMAQLLSLNGQSVLLIERAPIIGGSFARFYRKGIPFDTGFHFTGGFGKTGTLHDMFTILGINDKIEPIYLTKDTSNRIFFEDIDRIYNIAPGYPEVITKLKKLFPDEQDGIDKFFERAEYICDNTPLLDIQKLKDNNLPFFATPLKDDFISLTESISQFIKNPYLKSILSLYCLCYGTNPNEVSFANHCRISLWLFESIARVKNGGDAFISAFKEQFKINNVDIRTNTFIKTFENIADSNVKTAKLNTGDEIEFDNCILTIHPKEILKLLPKQFLRKAFIERVNDFEESNGFFSVHGYLKNYDKEFEPSLNSILSSPDLNKILDPDVPEQSNLVVMTSIEEVNGKKYKVVNAFIQSYYENIKQFETGEKRPVEYIEYKKKKTEQIVKRIYKHFPEFKNHLHILESASVLTYKDYLNSPYGSAYGIKQKAGQINLLGRLPLKNLFAAGQSALLPGLVGGMMSSFIVLKSIIGNEAFQNFIKEKLK